jgi:hypothetical protein
MDVNVHMKNIPFPHMIPLMYKLFYKKYQKRHSETVVKAWLNFWGKKQLTQCKANLPDASPLRGGIPPDNNVIKSGNNKDKSYFDRHRSTVNEFLGSLSADKFGPESTADVEYNSLLKQRNTARNSGHNKALNNAKFFTHVHKLLEEHLQFPEKMHILNHFYPLYSAEKDIPRGSYWFHGERGLKKVQAAMQYSPFYDHDDCNLSIDVATYIEEHNNLREKVEKFFTNPEELDHTPGVLTFDNILQQIRSLHLVRRIRFRRTDWNHPTNRALLHWCEMMKKSGLVIIEEQKIVARKGLDGFLHALAKCTCIT